MSNFKRLERVVRSYTGILRKRRKYYYSADNARAILTELGLKMSPKTFSYLTDSTVILEEFVSQLHETEEHLGYGIVKDMNEIHPGLEPDVIEDNGHAVFTIQHKGRSIIIAEIRLPWLPTESQKSQETSGNLAPGGEFKPTDNPFEVPIE
jgi:hypothetical protein